MINASYEKSDKIRLTCHLIFYIYKVVLFLTINGIYMKKIIIISFIIFFISCNSDMVQKGMEAIKDPRLPEINIKYNGENIPSGSGSCILTGAKSDTICSEAIFTIENIGTADLELVDSPSIKIENDDLNEFIISSFPPSNILDSGRNLTFSVEFCPINPYEKNVTIVIQNNDFDENNYSFTLRGIAVPQTDFRARLRRGIAPLDVDFESLSEGNISLLEWDFNGDGTTDATGETATYSYTKSGKFSVVLTATGTGGSNYCIKTNYVTISNPAMNIIDNAFEGAVAVRAAYVDTDSYIDIVGVANSDDLKVPPVNVDEISWWKNDGNGNFTKNSTPISTSFIEPNYLHVIDMDFDGDNDIVCQNRNSEDQIYWWSNGDDQGGGDGTVWNQNIITPSYSHRLYFEPADMDGDNDTDLISFHDSDSDGYSNSVLYDENRLNEGSGWDTQTAISLYSTGGIGYCYYLYLADFNNDLLKDILLGGYNGIRWYQNSGDNINYTEYIIANISTSDNLSSKAVADIDNDSDIDIFSIVSYTDTKIVWLNNKSGTTGWEETWDSFTITTDSKGTSLLYPYDVNSDGKVDLIGCSQSYGDIFWWENNGIYGDSTWKKHYITNNFSGVKSIDAADLNGDGSIDIIGAAYYGCQIAWWDISHPDWYSSDVDNSIGTPQTLFSADLDKDGDLDLISGSIDINQVVWYENDGTGNFIDMKIIDPSLKFPAAFYAIDLDKDSDIDIVASGSENVVWYENDGENDYTRHDIATTGISYAYDISAADLNGDSETDIICTSHYNNSVLWWDNDGNENFNNKNTLDSSINWPRSIDLADVDNNLSIDIVVAGSGTSGLAWYRNNGYGSFTKNILGSGSNSVHFKDLDKDSDIDIVVYECINNEIDFWINDGAENFIKNTTPVGTDINGDYSTISIADINGDGYLDVACANQNNDEITWWENDGNQIFDKHLVISGFDYPTYIHAADFDDDGDIDITAVSNESDSIKLWENNIREYSLD